jgi:hypothetical protein
MAALEKENAALKAALEIRGHMDLEGWGEYATQELRDQMAAAALVAAGLHPRHALNRLGFAPTRGEPDEWHPIADAVFRTPGVKAILDKDAEKFSEDKTAVLKRLQQIALYEEPAIATRAAATMSKMIAGWGDGEAKKGSSYVANFLVSLGEAANKGRARIVGGESIEDADPDRIIDAEEFLALDTGDIATVEDKA